MTSAKINGKQNDQNLNGSQPPQGGGDAPPQQPQGQVQYSTPATTNVVYVQPLAYGVGWTCFNSFVFYENSTEFYLISV